MNPTTKRTQAVETPEAAVGDEQMERAPESAAQEETAAAEPVSREAELEAELAATKDRLLRALADLENLRRRTERELEEARKYAITGFARELLEVADNLSRALASIPPQARGEIGFLKDLAEGIEMTEKALLACFERHKIAKVEPQVGEKFDHSRHQAMFEVETDEYEPGTIAQVLQPGYVIDERLLRPALVGVAKAPSKKAAAAETGESGGGEGTPGQRGERLDTTA